MSDPTHVKNQLCQIHLKGLLHFKQNAISVIIFYLRSIATIVANHCMYCRPIAFRNNQRYIDYISIQVYSSFAIL